MHGGKRELGSQPSCSMAWTRVDFNTSFSKDMMENIFWVELRRGVFSRNDVSPLFLTRILSCKKFSFLLTLACVDMDNYSWEISI